MRNKLTAKGHTVGHLQLSPDEILKYNDIPIVRRGAVNFVANYRSAHLTTSLSRYGSDHAGHGTPELIEKQLRTW
jgi:sarcosine oxidase/L-pipecolate oxidase